ncbi:MAG: DNA gyrase inhibitor YacG [Burkholderiales bacterium]
MQSVKQVACPRCGALSAYAPANEWRPFCSERCKLIDLGLWASERYRVGGENAGPEAEPPPEKT